MGELGGAFSGVGGRGRNLWLGKNSGSGTQRLPLNREMHRAGCGQATYTRWESPPFAYTYLASP